MITKKEFSSFNGFAPTHEWYTRHATYIIENYPKIVRPGWVGEVVEVGAIYTDGITFVITDASDNIVTCFVPKNAAYITKQKWAADDLENLITFILS